MPVSNVIQALGNAAIEFVTGQFRNGEYQTLVGCKTIPRHSKQLNLPGLGFGVFLNVFKFVESYALFNLALFSTILT